MTIYRIELYIDILQLGYLVDFIFMVLAINVRLSRIQILPMNTNGNYSLQMDLI